MLALAKLLNHYFFLEGVVIRGRRYGSSINFPTVNLLFVQSKSLPKLGCYLTLVQINDDYYRGLTCLIQHPENKTIIACETHLLNFDRDVYGERVRVFFLQFFRNNISFVAWKQNHVQIIAQDLAEWEKKFTIKRKWVAGLKKNAKIESNLIPFLDE